MAKKSARKHYMKNKDGDYKNGQAISVQNGNILTYYFKDGKVKAKGKFIDKLMEGRWIFNRESGQLWSVGNFKNSKKHGEFVRYDKTGNEEYRAKFVDGKLVEKLL